MHGVMGLSMIWPRRTLDGGTAQRRFIGDIGERAESVKMCVSICSIEAKAVTDDDSDSDFLWSSSCGILFVVSTDALR